MHSCDFFWHCWSKLRICYEIPQMYHFTQHDQETVAAQKWFVPISSLLWRSGIYWMHNTNNSSLVVEPSTIMYQQFSTRMSNRTQNVLAGHLPFKPNSALRHQESLEKRQSALPASFFTTVTGDVGKQYMCLMLGFHSQNNILLDTTTILIIIPINDSIKVCCENCQLLLLHSFYNKSQCGIIHVNLMSLHTV